MKKTFVFGALAAAVSVGPALAQDEAAASAVAAEAPAAEAPAAEAPAAEAAPVDEAELLKKVSYAFGMQVFAGMQARGVERNPEDFAAGVSDQAAGSQKMKPQEAQEVLLQYQELAARKMREEAEAQGKANVEAGNKFLEDNAKKDGVTVTDSGLQYEVMKAAEGPKPKATDTVQVHYHGTLMDGTVFDSSVDRGQPATFPLNRVIAGWTEGVQLMNVGSKFKFTIPPELAYGERGAPPKIGPNSVLQFEVELLEIQ